MKIIKDDFNSEIFEMKMGNIILPREEEGEVDVNRILEYVESDGYNHISVKIPTLNKRVLNEFLIHGFYMADTLLEYVYRFDGNELPVMSHKTVIRDFKESDVNDLMEIAKGAFDYDRYHSDPTLDNALCDRYYEQWILNSCHGFADKIIVAEFDNEVVGFTTGTSDHSQEYGHLVLSAVSSKYRGHGIYTSMIYEGVKWLKEEGFKGLIVGTQINNIAVQKAWIKLGFTVFNSEYVLHLHL